MGLNLCVSDSVSDDVIQNAWGHFFGNNAIERIETRDSKKIIHLHLDYKENLEEDFLEDIAELYEDLEREGMLIFSLRNPSIGWWIYGQAYPDDTQFEVTFE